MTSPATKTYLITGANAGLGLDATRQLALRDDVRKVYMACRSKDKADAAIEDLVNKFHVSREKLEFVPFDGSSSKEEIEAVWYSRKLIRKILTFLMHIFCKVT